MSAVSNKMLNDYADGIYLLTEEPTIAKEQLQAIVQLLQVDVTYVYMANIEQLMQNHKLSLFSAYTYGGGYEGAAVKGEVITLLNIDSPRKAFTGSGDDLETDSEYSYWKSGSSKSKNAVIAELEKLGIDKLEAKEAITLLIERSCQCIASVPLGKGHLLLVLSDT